MNKSQPAGAQGFTLMELLIVISILMLLMILVLANFRTQLARGRDINRKTDLSKIQKAFEEYYNDNQCYPSSSPISNCSVPDPSVSTYMTRVPCDPKTKAPYLFIPGTPTACDGYHVCAQLEDLADTDIGRIGCDPINGCGWGAGYNYCVVVGSSVTAPGFDPQATMTPTQTPVPTATPLPSPTPTPGGTYYCAKAVAGYSSCDQIGDPVAAGCPRSYVNGCSYMGVYQCDNPDNRCLYSY